MYTVIKRIEIAGAHRLNLPYESKCETLHGHNWIVEVEITGERLNISGMLIDFTCISKVVNQLDHIYVNEVLPKDMNPTAENIACWVACSVDEELSLQQYEEMKSELIRLRKVEADLSKEEECNRYGQVIEHELDKREKKLSYASVSKVTVQESEGNIACYIP